MRSRFTWRVVACALLAPCLVAPSVHLRAAGPAVQASPGAPAAVGARADAPGRTPADAPPELPADAPAEDDGKTRFLRYVDDDKAPRLESAIVSYRNADGVVVHLVSAVHVGEKSYYDGLSKTFKQYDALLYEMVKPKASGAPVRGKKSGGMVSGFQRFLKDVLELEFQLDAIDYSPRNFVHADLDAETFKKLQEERGESLFTLMLKSMMTEMARAGQPGAVAPISVFDVMAAMNSPDAARQYKLLLARQFNDVDAQIAAVEGPDGTVLLTERNKAALRVLEDTIARGKKNIGVFYGAGHMRGIEETLVGEMGFERTAVEWRVAWDMTPAPATQPVRRPKAVGEREGIEGRSARPVGGKVD